MSETLESDLLTFDVDGADGLARLMSETANQLLYDYFAVDRMLDRASAVLRFDARTLGHADPVLGIRRMAREVEDLAGDLHRRVGTVRQFGADTAQLDALTTRIATWTGPRRDPAIVDASAQRFALLLSMSSGDGRTAGLVARAMDSGLGYADALEEVQRETIHDARVAGLIDAFDVTTAKAQAMIVQIDLDILGLQARGIDLLEAEATVSLALQYSADLDDALAYAEETNASLIDSMSKVIAGQGLGITAAEFDALIALRDHFPQLDRLPGSGLTNDKISIADLEHIVENECRFTDGQVFAAAAVIANPGLINRLDTARDDDEVIGPDRFGGTEPGDGIISLEDVRAFGDKAQLTRLLAPFADEIDVASDPMRAIDGIHSRSDLEAFLADAETNGTPESVTTALSMALENGWFDQNWFQEHREELAYAAAMVAGGTVVFLSAGTATPLVLVMAGAAGGVVAGGTVLAVNSTTDDELTEGLARGTVAGVLIGVSAAGLAGGVGSVGKLAGAEKTVASLAMGADATSVVSAGATDILMPEELEDQVKAVAGATNDVVVPFIAINTEQLRDVALPLASGIVFD